MTKPKEGIGTCVNFVRPRDKVFKLAVLGQNNWMLYILHQRFMIHIFHSFSTGSTGEDHAYEFEHEGCYHLSDVRSPGASVCTKASGFYGELPVLLTA